MDYRKALPTIYTYGATPCSLQLRAGECYFVNGTSLYGCITGQISNDDIPLKIKVKDLRASTDSDNAVTNPRVIVKGGYVVALENGTAGATISGDTICSIKPEIEDMLTALYLAVSYLDPSLIYSMVNRLSTASKNMLPEACVGMRHKVSSSEEIVAWSL